MSEIRKWGIVFAVVGWGCALLSASPWEVKGVVTDADTGEKLPFVQILFTDSALSLSSGEGTTTDLEGAFSLSTSNHYDGVAFRMIGYKTFFYPLRSHTDRQTLKVRLEPEVVGLEDVVVKPGKTKRQYQRKNNPAVELIRQVIAHKDSGTVYAQPFFTAEVYHRMSFAMDNFSPNFQKGFWKSMAFAEKYIDTTGVYPALTVSIRENLGKEYFQQRPHRESKVIERKRFFGIESLMSSQDLEENLKLIFHDVRLQDNDMKVLMNRFVSPLSSTLAVSYYQYYILDTLMVEDDRCIDLAFVPVHSQTYGFTGHLYIMDDSTYAIKRYTLSMPADINLNFLSGYQLEHDNQLMANGLWAPCKTTISAKFYLLSRKKNIIARQTKIYHGFDLESPIVPSAFADFLLPDTLWQKDSTSIRDDFCYWDEHRPEPLSFYEKSVMDLVEEFKSSPQFSSLLMAVDGLTTNYVATVPPERWGESKFDIGPVFSTISYNVLEGARLRLGGGTTGNFHPHWFLSGYAAFGTQDLRPKGNFSVMYSFDKKRYHQYHPLRHFISLTAQYDVDEPAAQVGIIQRDNILMSIPTSQPVMRNYQYVWHAKCHYMREWTNHLTLKTQLDIQHNTPAGALHYDRVTGYDSDGRCITRSVDHYWDYEMSAELRYSPGKNYVPINRSGIETPFSLDQDAPVVSLKHSIGYLDDRPYGGKGFVYNHTQLTAEKRFWLSAFGHVDLRMQGGWVWNAVPFTKLYAPATSTSIFLGKNAFNQLQPMEFIFDRYVGWYMSYHLKGWILNRIPGVNKLRLRGVVGFSGIYGALSERNNPFVAGNEGLYKLPDSSVFDRDGTYLSGYTSSPIGNMPYMELTAGLENIFKFFRIDYIRRLTYNDYALPDGIHRRSVKAWGRNGVKISVRFEL